MPTYAPMAVAGLLGDCRGRGCVARRGGARTAGQGAAGEVRWRCVPATARRAGGAGGLGRATSCAGDPGARRESAPAPPRRLQRGRAWGGPERGE